MGWIDLTNLQAKYGVDGVLPKDAALIDQLGGATGIPQPSSVMVFCVDQSGVVLHGPTEFEPPDDAVAHPGYQLYSGDYAADVAAALAEAKEAGYRTLERVGEMFPRWGNDAIALILVVPKNSGATYRNKANTADETLAFLSGVAGWRKVLLRGSADLSNNAADKVVLGFQKVSGTSLTGYNATSGATTTSLPCQIAGGGAAGLPGESGGASSITGKRVRFVSGPTAGLLNQCGVIVRNTTGSVTLAEPLPFTPVTGNSGDVFVIEEPGVAVGGFGHTPGGVQELVVAGVRCTGAGTVRSQAALAYYVGCDLTGPSPLEFSDCAGVVTLGRFYTDELGSTQNVGTGVRAPALYATRCRVKVTESCTSSTSVFNVFTDVSGDLGANCTWKQGFVQYGKAWVAAGNGGGDVRFGNVGGTVGNSPLRISSNITGNPSALVSGSAVLWGLQISGNNVGAASSCVKVEGQRATVDIHDLTSPDGGNSGCVVDVSSAIETEVTVDEAGVTATATLGGIRLADGALAPIADLALTNFTDARGNDVRGSAGKVV